MVMLSEMQKSGRAKKFARKYERYLMDHRLIVHAASGALHGRSKNLAEGGMAATVAGEIPMGEVVELEIQLPRLSNPLIVKAEVRYRQGFQYGFKFLPLTNEQISMVRSVVESLSPDE